MALFFPANFTGKLFTLLVTWYTVAKGVARGSSGAFQDAQVKLCRNGFHHDHRHRPVWSTTHFHTREGFINVSSVLLSLNDERQISMTYINSSTEIDRAFISVA